MERPFNLENIQLKAAKALVVLVILNLAATGCGKVLETDSGRADVSSQVKMSKNYPAEALFDFPIGKILPPSCKDCAGLADPNYPN